MSSVRRRFWLEAALAAACGALALLTLFWGNWLETVTGVDADAGDGSLEWTVVAGLAVVCALLSRSARAEWCRPRLSQGVAP